MDRRIPRSCQPRSNSQHEFAINMVLQYKKVGPWRDYLVGERVYIILSLVAKTVLAWLIWFGTLAPV